MLVRKGKGEEDTVEKRKLKALTFFNLIECLEELKKQGFFYRGEGVYGGNGECITMGQEKELLSLSKEWYGEKREEMHITAIWICFEHFITRKEKYMLIAEKMLEDKVQTVLWLDDNAHSVCKGSGLHRYIKGMPMVFEEIFRRCEMIMIPGKFYMVNLDEFKNTINESLFSLLYRYNYRQIQEGRIQIKEDRYEEKSYAWAGEFIPSSYVSEERCYLEIAIYHREYEEWEYRCEGKLSNIWSEEATEVYVAWCGEKLAEAGPEEEQKIPLAKLGAEEEIAAYLDRYHSLDHVLSSVF